MTTTVAPHPDRGRRLAPATGIQVGLGAASGAVATLLFMVVHALLILPIWGMAMPMVVAGSLCGMSISWSHARATTDSSAASWLWLNGVYLTSLIVLGVVSLIGFEPTWTFAELNTDEPPLGELFGAALPLMAAFSLAAAAPIWLCFGRTRASIAPILVTEALLVFLVGHNVAIIGLVDLTAEGWSLVMFMFGLVAFLGIANAAAYLALTRLLFVRH